VYRTSFPTPTHTGQNTELVFEGLDTFATATLNGQEILKSNNMFLPARIDIKHLLKGAGEENVMEIVFESALKMGTELEKQYGERTSMMRDKRRMIMRKAQVCPYILFSCLSFFSPPPRLYLTLAVSLGLGLGPYYCYVRPISPDIPGHLRFSHRRPLHHHQLGP
jgi:hypothetical protein